jgi:DNA-binding MarR family transcriptional regulator
LRRGSLLRSPLIRALLRGKYAIPILLALYEEGPIHVSDLVRQVSGHPSTVLKTVKALEKLGVIGRTLAPVDPRAIDMRVTVKGLAFVETPLSRWARVVRKWETVQ